MPWSEHKACLFTPIPTPPCTLLVSIIFSHRRLLAGGGEEGPRIFCLENTVTNAHALKHTSS